LLGEGVQEIVCLECWGWGNLR